MSNSKKGQTCFLSGQRTLFDVMEENEMILNLEIGPAVRRTLFEAIKGCPHSRGQIAGQMSEYLHRNVTLDQLNAWTAESRDDYRFPLEYAPAFCHSTKNYDLIQLVAGALRMNIFLPEDAADARLLQAELELRRMQDKFAEMKKAHEIMKRRGV